MYVRQADKVGCSQRGRVCGELLLGIAVAVGVGNEGGGIFRSIAVAALVDVVVAKRALLDGNFAHGGNTWGSSGLRAGNLGRRGGLSASTQRRLSFYNRIFEWQKISGHFHSEKVVKPT